MLTFRLESTIDDSQTILYNKLLCFNSENGNLEVFECAPFSISNNISKEKIFEKFGFKDTPKEKLIINEKVKNSYSFPFKLYVDITDKCQLNCKHCLTKSLNLNNELSIEKINQIIEECKSHGLFYVKLGGGEPLLHPNIFEIIQNFSYAGIFVSLSTNAFLINEETARFLKKYNVKVSISLEGPKFINDKIRGNNHYFRALEAIDILKSVGCNPLIRITLTKHMLDEDNIYEMINLAKQKNVKLKISYCRPAGSAIDNHLLIDYEDYSKYLSIIEILNRVEYKDLIILDEGMQLKQSTSLTKMLYNHKICGAANRSIHINSRGNISPCVFLGENYIEKDSNYKYGDMLNYWNECFGNKIREIRNIQIPEHCIDCERLCKLECSATRYYFNKNFEISDPNCLKGVKKCLKLK